MSDALTTLLSSRDWLLADGATGTNLFNMGLQSGDAPEFWNEQEPEKIRALYRGAVEASHAYNSVSRKHARISYVAPDMVEIKNLSGNGTLVDGRLVDKLILQDCRENSHKIQLGPKGVILMLQPGSLPI